MTLQQVQNFHCQFFLVHRDWIKRHQIRHESFANSRVRLKMPHEISVREYAEKLVVFVRHNGSASKVSKRELSQTTMRSRSFGAPPFIR